MAADLIPEHGHTWLPDNDDLAPGAPPWAPPPPHQLTPPSWHLPTLAHHGPVYWTDDEVAEVQDSLPQYVIKGPGKYVICDGESGLFGANSRLITSHGGMRSVQQAAQLCDGTPGCTHFSVSVGPPKQPDAAATGPLAGESCCSEEASGWRQRQGAPLRVDLCKGPLVTVADVEGLSTFAGIKRSVLGDDGPPPGPRPPEESLPSAEGMDDGPIELHEAAMGLAALLLPRSHIAVRRAEMRLDRLDRCKWQQARCALHSRFIWRSFL